MGTDGELSINECPQKMFNGQAEICLLWITNSFSFKGGQDKKSFMRGVPKQNLLKGKTNSYLPSDKQGFSVNCKNGYFPWIKQLLCFKPILQLMTKFEVSLVWVGYETSLFVKKS